jgi:hypothetical protein
MILASVFRSSLFCEFDSKTDCVFIVELRRQGERPREESVYAWEAEGKNVKELAPRERGRMKRVCTREESIHVGPAGLL